MRIDQIVVPPGRYTDHTDLSWHLGPHTLEDGVAYAAWTSLRRDGLHATAVPALIPEHWHLAVSSLASSSVVYTPKPEWLEKVARWFRRNGVDPDAVEWTAKAAERCAENEYTRTPPAPTRPPDPVQAAAPATTEQVYFIQAGETGLIKIGVAIRPRKRLAMLQCGSSIPLLPLGVMVGGHDLEASLHRRFAHLRRLGEWFAPADELLAFIGREATPWPNG